MLKRISIVAGIVGGLVIFFTIIQTHPWISIGALVAITLVISLKK